MSINPRIALSGVTIMATLALVTSATFAFFSDEATSTSNTFTAGTLTLLLDGSEDVTGTFAVTDMAPGDIEVATVGLTKDASSIDIAKVGFMSDADNATFGADLLLRVHEGSGVSGGECTGTEVTDDIETALTITTLTVDNFGSSFFDSLFDGTGLSPGAFSNSGTNTVCLEVEFKTDANSANQGATTDVTFTFKGLQDATQTP